MKLIAVEKHSINGTTIDTQLVLVVNSDKKFGKYIKKLTKEYPIDKFERIYDNKNRYFKFVNLDTGIEIKYVYSVIKLNKPQKNNKSVSEYSVADNKLIYTPNKTDGIITKYSSATVAHNKIGFIKD